MVAMAKYVQERLPVSRAMLRALEGYLLEKGWQEIAPHTFEGIIDERLQVEVPPTPFTPTVIDAAEDIADILELLAIQQKANLDEIIAEVSKHIGPEQGVRVLNMRDHQCFVNEGGCILYERSLIEDLDASDDEDRLQYLWPREALELAEFIEANRAYLEERQGQLDAMMQPIAEALFTALQSRIAALHERGTYWAEVRREAGHELIKWRNDHHPLLEQWSSLLFLDAFSLSQQEALLLRAFEQVYRTHYPDASVEDDEGETDEPDDRTVSHEYDPFRYE